MKFIKWFFQEARYLYYFAIVIFIFLVQGAIRDREYFLSEKWSIIAFTLIVGGFATGMGVSLYREYKASQK